MGETMARPPPPNSTIHKDLLSICGATYISPTIAILASERYLSHHFDVSAQQTRIQTFIWLLNFFFSFTLKPQIDASSLIITVAGGSTSGFFGDGGPATAATLNGPNAVAVSSSKEIFIADSYNYRIRKVILPPLPRFFLSKYTLERISRPPPPHENN